MVTDHNTSSIVEPEEATMYPIATVLFRIQRRLVAAMP